MDAKAFWEVIGNYNQATLPIQIILALLIAFSVIIAYRGRLIWLPKLILGITNLFIGIVFFLYYGTEPIQYFFAFPLFILAGFFLIWESNKHNDSEFHHFNRVQSILLVLVIFYPLFSIKLGHSFPQMVTNIMPCPVISLSIIIYSCYEHKNKILLALMTIWGLTGVKAFFVNAFEDTILLACGVYCLYLLIRQFTKKKIEA